MQQPWSIVGGRLAWCRDGTSTKWIQLPTEIALCYKLKRPIGEGTYGKVFIAERKLGSPKNVAIKILSLYNKAEGVPPTTMREMALLKDLNHANIVTLYDICIGVESIAFVFELCETDLGQVLDAKIKSEQYLPRWQVRSILQQLLRALDHVHGRQVLHRDIKPQNVLLTDGEKTVKLADFGLSVKYGLSPAHEQRYCTAITLWYRPPELLLGEIYYGTAAEVWSVGCIFAELLMTQTLLNGASECQQLRKIFALLDVPENVDEIFPDLDKLLFLKEPIQHKNRRLRNYLYMVMDPTTEDLLMRMLCIDPSKRITVKEALAHPYFADDTLRDSIVAFEPSVKPSKLSQLANAIVPRLRQQDVGAAVSAEHIYKDTLTRLAQNALTQLKSTQKN